MVENVSLDHNLDLCMSNHAVQTLVKLISYRRKAQASVALIFTPKLFAMVLIREMTSARRIQDLKRSLLSNACGVVLKESLGKGMGVFATKAFKKDSFVTVYPSHMVGAELDIQCVVWMRNREYTMEYVNKLSKDYCQRIIGGVIAGDPALLEDGLGHMVNDGARSRSPADVEVYKRISKAKENVIPHILSRFPYDIREATVFMRAIRDIEIGEELFYSYGAAYWSGDHQ